MKSTLILGAGLSGLSLAYRMANEGRSIILLEKREAYLEDRTWCFWNTQAHPFEDLIDYRWSKWQVSYAGNIREYEASGYEYQMISSAKFYKVLLERLKSFKNVEIHLGCEVVEIASTKNLTCVKTSKGDFISEQVYDSRPVDQKGLFSQHFYGWHIKVDHPVFDPSKMVLMDFDVDQSKGIHFMYILPFSKYDALIEPTFLSRNPLQKKEYEKSLNEYLSTRYGIKAFTCLREEKGILPLTTKFRSSSFPNLKIIGTCGGWTRSSTGYAFLAIQEAIERHLAGKDNRKIIERMLDKIFLSYIENHPSEAPHLFSRLFERNDPGSLVRFLSGKSTPYETMKVVSTLPKLPFMKEVFR